MNVELNGGIPHLVRVIGAQCGVLSELFNGFVVSMTYCGKPIVRGDCLYVLCIVFCQLLVR